MANPIDFAVYKLAQLLPGTKQGIPRIERRMIQLGPLYPPDDPMLWKGRQLRGYSVAYLIDVWEQYTYGYIKTQDLADELTPGEWLKDNLPPAYRLYTQIECATLALLHTMGRHDDITINMGLQTLLLQSATSSWGIHDGKVVCQHTPNITVQVNLELLTKPLQTKRLTNDPLLLKIYEKILTLQEPQKKLQALNYFGYIALSYPNVTSILAAISKLPTLAKFHTHKSKSLPTLAEVERIIFSKRSKQPAEVLRKKLSAVLSGKQIQALLGSSKSPNNNRAYTIYHNYKAFLEEGLSC